MGIFRGVLTRQSDGTVIGEMPLSVMPGERVEALGNHAFWDPYSLEISRRIGVTWNRCWDNARPTSWMKVQPEKAGQFRWDYADAWVNNGLKQDYKILGMLDWPWGTKWAFSWVTWKRPHWMQTDWQKEHEGGVLRTDLIENETFMKLWDEYVFETVKHFKGRIRYWEILNEPYNSASAAWVMQIYRRTVPIVRKANPDAIDRKSVV